jgi:3D (Asp-Asp-Asp) domain-containing protein
VQLRRFTITALVVTLSACAPRGRVPVATSPPKPSTVAGRLAVEETPFVATAYCQDGKTASGAHTASGTVAADPDVLPIGTRIRVSGLTRGRDGIYRVMDTGARVEGRHIDIFIESCAEARRFGRQRVRVAVTR